MWYVMDWNDDLTQEIVLAGPFNRAKTIQVLCVVGSWIEEI